MTDCYKHNSNFRFFPEAWVYELLGKRNGWALCSVPHGLETAPWERTQTSKPRDRCGCMCVGKHQAKKAQSALVII